MVEKRGLIVPFFLTGLLITIHSIALTNFFNSDLINNLLRGSSLIIVSIVVAYLADKISKKELELNDIIKDLKRSNEDFQQFACNGGCCVRSFSNHGIPDCQY